MEYANMVYQVKVPRMRDAFHTANCPGELSDWYAEYAKCLPSPSGPKDDRRPVGEQGISGQTN